MACVRQARQVVPRPPIKEQKKTTHKFITVHIEMVNQNLLWRG